MLYCLRKYKKFSMLNKPHMIQLSLQISSFGVVIYSPFFRKNYFRTLLCYLSVYYCTLLCSGAASAFYKYSFLCAQLPTHAISFYFKKTHRLD